MAVITILVTSILQIKDLLPIVNFLYLAVSICLFILHQLFYLYQYFVSSVVIRNLIVLKSNRLRKHKQIGMESIAWWGNGCMVHKTFTKAWALLFTNLCFVEWRCFWHWIFYGLNLHQSQWN